MLDHVQCVPVCHHTSPEWTHTGWSGVFGGYCGRRTWRPGWGRGAVRRPSVQIPSYIAPDSVTYPRLCLSWFTYLLLSGV